MSWFGSNENGWHKQPKLGKLGRHVHRPVIISHNGVKHSIVGYESHNSEQYMARTAKVVEYRGFPGMADEEYIIPSRTEEYGRFNSPPSKDHHRTTHGKSGNLNFDTDLTDDDDDDKDLSVNKTNGTRPNNMKEQEYHNDEKNKRYGFTKEGSGPNHLRDQEDYYERVNPKTNVYSPPTYTVPISTHQDKEKGNDYATRARMGPFFGTPPRNETSSETSNFKPKANSPPQFNPQPKIEQGNDYATRARMGPFFGTSPRNETSYETSNFEPISNSPPQFNPQPKKEQGNDYATRARMGPFFGTPNETSYETSNFEPIANSPPQFNPQPKKEQGNNYATRARMGPYFGTPPRNEASYETSNFDPIANSPPKVNPQPKKEQGNDYATRARMGPFFGTPNETSYETSNFKPIANSPPQFNPQPKKEQGNNNQQTIDSTEARRRYGKGAPGAGPGLYAEDKYSGGTIDSKEAARRYNGVLLTD